jgi:hypothetical protein
MTTVKVDGALQEKLQAAILEAFNRDELAQFMRGKMNMNLGDVSAPADNDVVVAFLVLEWVRRKELWEDFVPKLRAAVPTSNTLGAACQALLDFVQTPVPVPPGGRDDYRAIYLHPQGAFLDRDKFRTALKGVLEDGLPRILLLRGPKKCGKSHCAKFVMHLRQRKGNGVRATHLDFTKEAKAAQEPAELARKLAVGLELSDPFPPALRPEQTEPRWGCDLADWLARLIAAEKLPAWIALDGFGDVELSRDAHDLVQHMLELAATTPLLRLVLLDYGKPIPTEAEDFAMVHNITYLDDQDVKDFWQGLTQDLDSFKGANKPAVIYELFVGCKQGLPPHDPDRMLKLAGHMESRVRRLLPPP